MLNRIIFKLFLTLVFLVSFALVLLNIYKENLAQSLLHRYHLQDTVKVQGIRGFFPFELSINTLEVQDQALIKEIDLTLSIKDSLLRNHISLSDVRVKEVILKKDQKSSTFVPITFPDLTPLKFLDIKRFSTKLSHEDQSFKGELFGKLSRGILRSKIKLDYQDSTYTGRVKATNRAFEVVSKYQDHLIILQAYRKDSHHLEIRGSYQDYKLKSSLLSTPDAYILDMDINNKFNAHFSYKGKNLTLHTLTFDFPKEKRLMLKKPIDIVLEKNITVDLADFDIAGETLTLKKLSLAEPLSGFISMKTSQNFWKTLFPDAHIVGGLTLKGSLGGHRKNPELKIEILGEKIKHTHIKPLRMEKAKITCDYKDHQAKIHIDVDGKNNLKLKGVGNLDFSHEPMIYLETQLDLNLRHLNRLMPKNDRIDGQIRGAFSLKGPLFFPAIKGRIDLHNGYFENYIIGTHIRDLNGHISVQDQTATLALHGRDDFKGEATARGKINLFPLTGTVEAKLTRFYLSQSDLFTSLVTGSATVDLAKKHVHGNLIAHKVVVDLDQLTPSSTPKIQLIESTSLRKEETDIEQPQTSPSKNEYFLDLTMTPENHVIVRGFGIQSLWSGAMKLYGTTPDFKGDFTLIRGTIDILDRVIPLSRGKITFDHEIDRPILDIDLKKKIQEFDILVNLQGRSDNPKFTFMSSPSLSQEEILGLLLMGRRSAAGSIGQLVEVSSSLSGLTSQGNENFFGKFRKAFGIEALEIKKIEQDGNADTGQALSVRKQITPDFTLVLEQGLTSGTEDTKTTKASVEANITENVNVAIDVSSDKSGGVGLNWVKRY